MFITISMPTGPALAQAGSTFFDYVGPRWHWRTLDQPCQRDCTVSVFAGRYALTEMTEMFGLDGVATPAFDRFKPAWNWDYGDSWFVGGTIARRFASIGRLIDFEAELGAGKRFGDLDAGEAWAAIYLRWVWFPWNDYVRTTIATSTGVNWATHIDAAETLRTSNRKGSQVLHYFSPEMTFALPRYPDVELLFRVHHRSGGKILFGDVPLFNGVDGGAHYGTAGLRWRF